MNNIEKVKTYNSDVTYRLLSSLTMKARKNAPQFWEHNTHVVIESECMNEEWCFFWFKSSGCIKEKTGSCIMCKYGSAPTASQKDIFKSFIKGMNSINRDYDFFFCSVSGSMLEHAELSRKTYFDIIHTLSKTSHKSFGFETRCDTINGETIKKTQAILKGRLKQVFLGLEVSDQNILQFCLNKNQKLSDFLLAVNILREFGVNTCANILVGMPFFGLEERINIAIKSVKWALKNGASRCFLFPIHVKDYTLLGTLYTLGLYNPPSLWELIEILTALSQEISQNRIGISWYRPQKGDPCISISPTTCPLCFDSVICLLKAYDKRPDNLIIKQLQSINCSCYDEWKTSKLQTDPFTVDKLLHSYQSLWQYYNGKDDRGVDIIKKCKCTLYSVMNNYEGKFNGKF